MYPLLQTKLHHHLKHLLQYPLLLYQIHILLFLLFQIIFSNKLNWVNGDKGYKVPDIIYDVKLNGMSVDYNMKVVKKKPNRLL